MPTCCICLPLQGKRRRCADGSFDVDKSLFGGRRYLCDGQLLIDYTKLTPARILVSFVVLGVILGGLGLYQPLIEFAGAGATVPLTGFGATLAKGVREAVAQKGWFGALTGGLSASAGGITAAIVAALTAGLLFHSAEK